MKLVNFISMSGIEVQIPESRLNEYDVKMDAEKHFGQKLMCTPCLFGSGTVAAGWQFISKSTGKVIGYMTLVTGEYHDYPEDFEYGVTIMVPISKMWTSVFNYNLRYITDKIEIRRNT